MHSHVDVNGNNANTAQRYTREKTDVNISILSSSSPSSLPPVPPNSPSKSPSLSPFHPPLIPSHTRISLLRMLMMICILYMIWITLSTIYIPCSGGMGGLTHRLHSASSSYSSQTLIDEYEYLHDDTQAHPTIANCDYPVVTLISHNYCRPTFVLYESLLRAAYRDGYTTCLLIVYVNHTINATNEFDTSRWTNRSAPWPEDLYCKQMIQHAQQIHMTPEGRGVQVPISWWELPPIAFPDWFAVKGTSWAYSMHKIHTFGLPIFSHYRSPDVPTSSLNRTHRIQRQKHQNRFLFLDSDMMFVQHLDRAFQDCHSSYGTGAGVDIHICGVTDQSDGCHTRRGMNGGYLNVHPSKYLHYAFTSCLNERRCSCMSNDYHWSDQELIQCFCNMIGGTTVNPAPIRADIRCRMLPIYNSVWPPKSHCGDVKAGETRAIHFAAYAKPWDEPKKNHRLNPWPNHPGRKWLTDPHSLFWACIHDAANEINEPQKRIHALNACEPTW